MLYIHMFRELTHKFIYKKSIIPHSTGKREGYNPLCDLTDYGDKTQRSVEPYGEHASYV